MPPFKRPHRQRIDLGGFKAFKVGDNVVGMGGWQEYAVVDANQRGVLQKVDTTHVPLSAYLGAAVSRQPCLQPSLSSSSSSSAVSTSWSAGA